MQYIVQVSGDVLERQNRAYIVNAKAKEDAQLIAKQNFCDDFSVDGDTMSVKYNRRPFRAVIAFVLMLIPIFLSFIGWGDGHNLISISPDLTSCLYSMLIYVAFVVRFKGIQRTMSSWIDILFCVFMILLLSSFIKIILVNETFNLFGFSKINIRTDIVLLVAIILSWLGLKPISLACMAVIMIFAMFNITSLSTAMKSFYGPLYLISAFLGIMMYLSIEPACLEAISQIKKFTTRTVTRIGKDVSDIKEKPNNSVKELSDKKELLSERNEEN